MGAELESDGVRVPRTISGSGARRSSTTPGSRPAMSAASPASPGCRSSLRRSFRLVEAVGAGQERRRQRARGGSRPQRRRSRAARLRGVPELELPNQSRIIETARTQTAIPIALGDYSPPQPRITFPSSPAILRFSSATTCPRGRRSASGRLTPPPIAITRLRAPRLEPAGKPLTGDIADVLVLDLAGWARLRESVVTRC
jgi:hypothetical protein